MADLSIACIEGKHPDKPKPEQRINRRTPDGRIQRIHPEGSRREYVSWLNMRYRCLDPSNRSYENYGGRGITICDRWLDSFNNFLTDMGKRPEGSSLERKDNSLGYNPDNCRWATATEQNNNKRNNVMITRDGVTRSLTAWAKLSGIKPSTVHQRYYVYKWSAERSLGWE